MLYTNKELQAIDQRYQAENALLNAIGRGNQDEAMDALIRYGKIMHSPSQNIFREAETSLSDFKNKVRTMNTLFRKTIEDHMVHPIHIHEYSSRFGMEIERAADEQTLVALILDMVKTYCSLVKNYSLSQYSKTIRDAVLYIHLHLYAPLSTADIAKAQNISPNYLSNQFKTEVGLTITDYIQKNRIQMAIKLLETTDVSIQDLAFRVGIEDASYFSKQFKKQVGLSPLQYQKTLRTTRKKTPPSK